MQNVIENFKDKFRHLLYIHLIPTALLLGLLSKLKLRRSVDHNDRYITALPAHCFADKNDEPFEGIFSYSWAYPPVYKHFL